jgi:hypothetical protein
MPTLEEMKARNLYRTIAKLYFEEYPEYWQVSTFPLMWWAWGICLITDAERELLSAFAPYVIDRMP